MITDTKSQNNKNNPALKSPIEKYFNKIYFEKVRNDILMQNLDSRHTSIAFEGIMLIGDCLGLSQQRD